MILGVCLSIILFFSDVHILRLVELVHSIKLRLSYINLKRMLE